LNFTIKTLPRQDADKKPGTKITSGFTTQILLLYLKYTCNFKASGRVLENGNDRSPVHEITPLTTRTTFRGAHH